MKKVTGLGGVFFKSKDVAKLNEWYSKELGFEITQWGASIVWGNIDTTSEIRCLTAWSLFKDDSNYFAPSTLPYMINYRVHDLKSLIEDLKNEGVTMAGGIDEYDYGKFAWIVDPEGRKIELWEPIDTGFGEIPPVWTKNVTGIAGLHLKSDDPPKIKEWYKKHLDIDEGFRLIDLSSNKEVFTKWQLLSKDDKVFEGTDRPYVFSYRAKEVTNKTMTDPEGNKIVLTN